MQEKQPLAISEPLETQEQRQTFRHRLTLNDADQNFATIRYGVTTLVSPARNAGQTSVTEVHLRSRGG